MQQGLSITWSGQCSGGGAAHGKAYGTARQACASASVHSVLPLTCPCRPVAGARSSSGARSRSGRRSGDEDGVSSSRPHCWPSIELSCCHLPPVEACLLGCNVQAIRRSLACKGWHHCIKVQAISLRHCGCKLPAQPLAKRSMSDQHDRTIWHKVVQSPSNCKVPARLLSLRSASDPAPADLATAVCSQPLPAQLLSLQFTRETICPSGLLCAGAQQGEQQPAAGAPPAALPQCAKQGSGGGGCRALQRAGGCPAQCCCGPSCAASLVVFCVHLLGGRVHVVAEGRHCVRMLWGWPCLQELDLYGPLEWWLHPPVSCRFCSCCCCAGCMLRLHSALPGSGPALRDVSGTDADRTLDLMSAYPAT